MEIPVSTCHSGLTGVVVVCAVVLHVGIQQSLEGLNIVINSDLFTVLPLDSVSQSDLEDISFLDFGRILAVEVDSILCKVSSVRSSDVFYSGSCLIGPLIDLILGILDAHVDKRGGQICKNAAVRVGLPSMGIPLVCQAG